MTGEYYLSGVQEVGSGFLLNADSTFEFFFSYGALDRYGQGTWQKQGDQLIFNSLPQPPLDFALVTSRTEPGNQLTIRITDPNTRLLRYVAFTIKNGNDVLRKMANEEGVVQFDKRPIEVISLRFELCPDRYSVFSIPDNGHNYFEFHFEPWVVEVFFNHVAYTLDGNTFTGPHPLLEAGKTYSFEKQ